MDAKNRTLATELILLGFSKDQNTNILLFVVFLFIYLVSVNANCLIFFLVLMNTNLHIPMYFFLCILSVLDLCMILSIVPKLLVDLLSYRRIISLAACRAQLYITIFTGGSESVLLILMAYDRYAAICRPLHYPVLMSWRNCYRMSALVLILSFIIFVLPSFGNTLTLCYPNQIDHFMCEFLGVNHLACEVIDYSEVAMVMTSFFALFPVMFIMVTYICILFSVLKMRSTRRAKAFSTCTSHIMVVVLCFGPLVVMNFGSSSKYSTNYGKYFSLFTNIISPTLNPLIYCLNNRDVKEAQRKFFLKFRH